MKRTCLQGITNTNVNKTCEFHTTIKKQIIYV
jgi:hypothetical protein